MEIKFSVEAAEHFKAVAYIYNSAIKRSKFKLIPFFVYMISSAFITFGLISIYKFMTHHQHFRMLQVRVGFGTILFGIVLFILLKTLMNRCLRTTFLDRQGMTLSEQSFSIENDFLVQRVRNSVYYTAWDDIIRVEDTPKFLFVFLDNAAAYYIPKGVSKSEENEISEVFISELRQKIGNK